MFCMNLTCANFVSADGIAIITFVGVALDVGVVNGHVDVKPMNVSWLFQNEANGGMKHVLEKQASLQSSKKQKRYTNFSDTDRAEIG